MEIELAWSAVFKIFGMGVLTYVIAPLLLVVRDSVVWCAIHRLVYTNKVREILSQYCLDRAWVDYGGVLPFRIYGSGENRKFYLGDREVGAETFFHQKETWEKLSAQTAEQGAHLSVIEKRIDRILKHYKQEDANPLRKNRENLYESFKQSFLDEREVCDRPSQ